MSSNSEYGSYRPDAGRRVRRAFARADVAAAGGFVVSREASRRMASRLDLVRLEPTRVLDAGCGSGPDLAMLRGRYPRAEIVGVDITLGLVQAARRRRTFAERMKAKLGAPASRFACADFARLPFSAGTFGLVWSNLSLAWQADLPAVFAELARVLEPGGLLMFSTYGPDTLKELRSACGHDERGPRVSKFADMHDVGDMLAGSGFAAPVMDMDMLTLTYPDLAALIADLRSTGQTYAGERPSGLLARGAWQRALASYEAMRREGRVPATVELVFGHAWKAKPALPPGTATITLKREAGRRIS